MPCRARASARAERGPTTSAKATVVRRSFSEGGSEKYFEVAGRRYSHIMDPRTGSPVQGVLGVAVLTNTGTDGDALDDAFFVLGPGRSRKLLKRNPSTEAFFFLPGPNRSWKMIHEAAR